MSIHSLRQLYDIIGKSLSILETTYSDAELIYPSLDTPYVSASPSEILTTTPEIVEATNLLVAAAEQLVATVKLPYLSLYDAAMAYHIPACLSFVERIHIAEILNTVGPSGMLVGDIAVRAHVHAAKLG